MKPRDAFSQSSLPPDIEAAAAHWLGLRDEGPMTPAQEAAFEAWLEADERHMAAFAEIDRMWNGFDSLQSVKPPVGDPDPDLLTPVRASPSRSRSFWRKFVPTTLATAAAIAVVWSSWRQPEEPGAFKQSVATRIGGHEVADLPDGSTIRLNTDTAVEVQFVASERRVRLLRGEAHFTVAKDSTRPFNVFVGDVSVQAVGTAFNVRIDSAAVEVLVTEGKVQVAAPAAQTGEHEPGAEAASAPAPLITAGHRVLIPIQPVLASPVAPAAITPVAPAEIVRALAWRQQRLEFEDAPLAYIVAEFNRYNEHKLVIVDQQLRQQRFGGKFQPHGYEGLVRLLESSFGVAVERRESDTVLRLPAAATSEQR